MARVFSRSYSKLTVGWARLIGLVVSALWRRGTSLRSAHSKDGGGSCSSLWRLHALSCRSSSGSATSCASLGRSKGSHAAQQVRIGSRNDSHTQAERIKWMAMSRRSKNWRSGLAPLRLQVDQQQQQPQRHIVRSRVSVTSRLAFEMRDVSPSLAALAVSRAHRWPTQRATQSNPERPAGIRRAALV